MKKKIFQVVILILLLSYYGFFLADKIDLTTTDLGRHLKNGEIAMSAIFNDGATFNQLLKTNFYSYTNPDYSFINHHWGSGVIFYLLVQLFGFSGLSLFHIIFSLLVFFIFFKLAQKNSDFTLAALSALLLIPLIAERREIRPEIFSYLFFALFLWILWHYRQGLISHRWLAALPFMGVVWVNLHIYFILGLFLIGAFLFEEIVVPALRDKKKIKNLSLAFALTALSFLIQPSGLTGALYPLNIFREYGYRIVENQSVWFLEKIGIIDNPNLLLFEIVFPILIVSFICCFFLNRKEFSLIFFFLGITFGSMAFLALRNFTLFSFFVLVILAYNFDKILKKINFRPAVTKAVVLILFLIIAGFGIINNQQIILYSDKGMGLLLNNNAAAEFYRALNIRGPVFNNYDIGSYLIYHLSLGEKVFVDNRPEAYPMSFFKEIYIPAQEGDNLWETLDKKYNFNAIFFSHRDYTPWGQEFLIKRVNDENWAPVFADGYAIIFLKRNDFNQAIIEKYEIPKNFFSITGIK